MKTVAAAAVVALVLTVNGTSSTSSKCSTGHAQGFAAIQPDPRELVGQIPSRFTSDARWFMRRYNCASGGVQVRRVDLGTYDLRFPKLLWRAAQATALSDEGVSSSILPLADGSIYRVILRGPVSAGDSLQVRRDVAFSVALF